MRKKTFHKKTMQTISRVATLVIAVLLLQSCAVNSDRTEPVESAKRVAPEPAPTVIQPAAPPVVPAPVQAPVVQAPAPQPKMVKLGKTTSNPLALIAEDFTHALLQVPGIASVRSQIGTRSRKSGFETAMVNSLTRQGYAFTQSSRANARNVLKTTTVQNPAKKQEVTFTLQLNHLALKRTYMLRPNYVQPVSGLFVKGVSPQTIKLDDRIFAQNF